MINATDSMGLASVVPSLSDSILQSMFRSESRLKTELLMIALYVLDFTKSFIGPILYKGCAIVAQVTIYPSLRYVSSFGNAFGSFSGPIDTSAIEEDDIDDSKLLAKAKLGPAIVTAEEDKKSSRATDRDVALLYKRGYNRYRYVSEAFIRRNKLKEEDEDNSAINDEEMEEGEE